MRQDRNSTWRDNVGQPDDGRLGDVKEFGVLGIGDWIGLTEWVGRVEGWEKNRENMGRK